MLSYHFFLAILTLFVAQIFGAKRPELKLMDKYKQFQPAVFNNKESLLKSSLLSRAADQLVISEPNNKTVLYANTTIVTLVQSTVQSLSKALVETSMSFICNGVLSAIVNSTLGAPINYTIDPNIVGSCILIATAPNNPEYAPSEPTISVVKSPLYYEGDLDNILHTGEIIDNFIRPSNSARIQVSFLINCTSGNQFETVYWTNQSNFLTLPKNLIGQCTFSTPNVPIEYAPIDTFTVTIEPTISFVTPTEGQTFTAGSEITAKLIATNDGDPIVVVDLICNNVLIETKKQVLKSVFIFGPSDKIYGKCEMTVDTAEPYYTGNVVEFSILSALIFKNPTTGQVISAGSQYLLEVDGTAGNGQLIAAVVGVCESGSFTETVTLGQGKLVTMGPNINGKCTLTATVKAPYFTPATTIITVYQNLNPDEISKIAKSLTLLGRIFSLTRPSPSKMNYNYEHKN